MEVDPILHELPEYTINANIVKELITERLVKDGLLTEEQEEEYNTKWQVIVIKRNWFESWCAKFTKQQQEKWQYKFVKLED